MTAIDHISRRVPGVLKRFTRGQRVVIVGDHTGLPKGTTGTVEPVWRNQEMCWFRTEHGSEWLVNNYEIDEINEVPDDSK